MKKYVYFKGCTLKNIFDMFPGHLKNIIRKIRLTLLIALLLLKLSNFFIERILSSKQRNKKYF